MRIKTLAVCLLLTKIVLSQEQPEKQKGAYNISVSTVPTFEILQDPYTIPSYWSVQLRSKKKRFGVRHSLNFYYGENTQRIHYIDIKNVNTTNSIYDHIDYYQSKIVDKRIEYRFGYKYNIFQKQPLSCFVAADAILGGRQRTYSMEEVVNGFRNFSPAPNYTTTRPDEEKKVYNTPIAGVAGVIGMTADIYKRWGFTTFVTLDTWALVHSAYLDDPVFSPRFDLQLNYAI